ncbi:hypothetical protein CVT24_007127 [Panaeolus cyanescens]|uniref:SMP-30/Gluconolactonase/LRE-like region domain-containing protein n=1 Tax=Panaeolus cyanescens TaxID=181874 RepID=A0A409VJW8_9AGAR|nr:hypothetical protein CVT24_007127 [Panaeolus cyanescens]
MACGTRTLTWVAVILSIILYRSGGLIKNCIVVKSPFTTGHVANADYDADCTTLRDHTVPRAESLSSCEDEVFWEIEDKSGKVVQRPVIFTCDPNRKNWNTVMGPLRNPDPLGSLWLYIPSTDSSKDYLDPSVKRDKVQRITLKNYPPNHDFHPLGAEAWPSHAGSPSNLYVVNHARHRTVIEQFVLDPASPTEALHIRTISSPYFLSPNSVALTSPDSFYVTNDHFFTRRLPIVGHVLPLIESVLGLPLGFVSHVSLHPVTSNTKNPIAKQAFAALFIPFANGISLSRTGTNLAVVSTSTNQVQFYTRDPLTNKLSQRKSETVILPFSPDNVNIVPSIDQPGKEDVVVAGHPNFPHLVAVAANKKGAYAASWAAVLTPKPESLSGTKAPVSDDAAPVPISSKVSTDGTTYQVKTLFQSNGDEFNFGFMSSSTALRDPDTGVVYVSGLYAEDGAIICKPGSGIGRKKYIASSSL